MNSFETFWHYHSEALPSKAPKGIPSSSGPAPFLIDEEPPTHFQVSLNTQRLRPNHLVTLRTEVMGWGRDVYGAYWYGAWRFKLPIDRFPLGARFKFLLDGEHWSVGDDLQVTSHEEINFDDKGIQFSGEGARHIHGYENLRVREDELQQNLLRVEYSEKEPWDVIVIGSGMGGGILADALSDDPKKPKVLVLEMGSLDHSSHIDNLPVSGLGNLIGGSGVRNYDFDPNGPTRFGLFPQMNLGGRSVHWSGLIPKMQDWELVNWPESVQNYLRKGKGYEAAEKLMRKHVAAGHYQEQVIEHLQKIFSDDFAVVNTPRSSHQPEFGPEEDPERHPESFLFRSTGTFSTAELLLDSLTAPGDPGAGRLLVNCNHLVTELLGAEGEEITGVVCHDLVGNRDRTFLGKFVVLAAGSLESPKLALLSKLKDPDKKIGVGLTDHPSYYAPEKGAFALRDDSPFAGPFRHARIFFYPKRQWQGHWFNVEIVINGEYWRSRHADDDVISAQHPPTAGSSVNFKFIFSSPLQEENWVRLGGPDGKVKIHVPPNPSGEKASDAAKSLCAKLMEILRVNPVDLNQDKNFHFGNGGTVNHAGGTLRMPTSDPKSPRVVDENLRFTSYKNLYVCDPSVYPYIPAANPSLTLAALALRLAKHITSRL
jgi:hypothetical protein